MHFVGKKLNSLGKKILLTRCALRARLSDEPDGRGTDGLRDRHSASRAESGMELTPLAFHGKRAPANLRPA